MHAIWSMVYMYVKYKFFVVRLLTCCGRKSLWYLRLPKIIVTQLRLNFCSQWSYVLPSWILAHFRLGFQVHSAGALVSNAVVHNFHSKPSVSERLCSAFNFTFWNLMTFKCLLLSFFVYFPKKIWLKRLPKD